MNYADSARIKAVLLNAGFSYSPTIDDADIVIFDTCSVRQKSEDKIFGKMMEIPKEKKIWLTGCMVQHYLKAGTIAKQQQSSSIGKLRIGNFVGGITVPNPTIIGLDQDDLEGRKKFTSENHQYIFVNNAFNPLYKKILSQFPHAELFFRIDDTGYLPYILKELGYDVRENIEAVNEYTNIIPHNANQLFSDNIKTVYVPISTGCNQFCAYCIVPFSRGLEKHRPKDDIINEIKHHVSGGAKEVVLLGQIVNKHPEFTAILRETLAIKGIKRLRYTSPYPTFYNAEIFEMHQNEEILCPHIHMPLQSGSTSVLKKMLRGYTSDQYKDFVDQIRSLSRPISITSDIIVGFCDETNEDFLQSLELTKYARFDMVYIGIYSPRPGTIAAQKYTDNVPANIKKERWSQLNDLLINISYENNQRECGEKKSMMVTEIGSDYIQGYTDNMKNVFIHHLQQTEKFEKGNFIEVKITEGKSFSLIGELI